MAATPSPMPILPCLATAGCLTARTPVTTAAVPTIQPRIETGLTSRAMAPTISATLPVAGFSWRAVFLRASSRRRSATVLSELIGSPYYDG